MKSLLLNTNSRKPLYTIPENAKLREAIRLQMYSKYTAISVKIFLPRTVVAAILQEQKLHHRKTKLIICV